MVPINADCLLFPFEKELMLHPMGMGKHECLKHESNETMNKTMIGRLQPDVTTGA